MPYFGLDFRGLPGGADMICWYYWFTHDVKAAMLLGVTKPFSPLGTKLHFHVNYSRKSIHRFHIDHNAPCLPPKILHNRELFPISPGC